MSSCLESFVIEYCKNVRNDIFNTAVKCAQVTEVFHVLFELFLYGFGLCCCRSNLAAMQTHSVFMEYGPCSDS